MSMKNMLLRKVRGDRAAVGLAAIAPILVTAVTLALAPPALAQFTSDSTVMSDPGDAAPPTGPDPEDAAIPAVADPPADVPVASATSVPWRQLVLRRPILPRRIIRVGIGRVTKRPTTTVRRIRIKSLKFPKW